MYEEQNPDLYNISSETRQEEITPSTLERIASTGGRVLMSGLLYLTLCNGTALAQGNTPSEYVSSEYGIIQGDGSNEEGFVAPPADRKLPPPPPRSISSAETMLGCCCCPVTPQSRTEAKKPPAPPVSITKLKH